jgi:hypothetical protein
MPTSLLLLVVVVQLCRCERLDVCIRALLLLLLLSVLFPAAF